MAFLQEQLESEQQRNAELLHSTKLERLLSQSGVRHRSWWRFW